MNKHIIIQDLGLKDYKDTWDYQETLFKDILDIKIKNRREDTRLETPNYFLFVEHPHVYTLGKSGDEAHVLISKEELAKRNIKVEDLTDEQVIEAIDKNQFTGGSFDEEDWV